MNAGTIGGFIVLVILVIAVIVALKKSQDKKALENFLNGLGDKILEIVLETINDINPRDYDTYEAFSKIVIKNVYVAVWDYVSITAQEAVEVDNITKAVFKLIDKETVVKFIDALFDKESINENLLNVYGSTKIEDMHEDKEDEQLQEEYSNEELYYENVDNEDLLPAEEKEIPQEELEKLIPPREDEEEEVDIEDDTVEILVDKKEIIQVLDKNDNILYYELDKNGKKTRVSKEYALANMGK